MPFVRVRLKSLIRKPYDFEPQSLGEHIRRRRLMLSLTQEETAEGLGVNTWTVLNWETGQGQDAWKCRSGAIGECRDREGMGFLTGRGVATQD